MSAHLNQRISAQTQSSLLLPPPYCDQNPQTLTIPPPPSPMEPNRSSNILETLVLDLLSVISPVSICMLLNVLLISLLSSPHLPCLSSSITAATLVYLESPSDSSSQKLVDALLKAAAFILIIATVTFLLLLLYYYNCGGFLKNYTRLCSFVVLSSLDGSILLSLPLDVISSILLLLNFSVVGVLSVSSSSSSIKRGNFSPF